MALYAEEHIDDAEAPLFLRFINLLMNDANFLLDEALSVIVITIFNSNFESFFILVYGSFERKSRGNGSWRMG